MPVKFDIYIYVYMPDIPTDPSCCTFHTACERACVCVQGDYKLCERLYKITGKNRSHHL